MIYRSCIEFVMECGEEVLTYTPQMESDLKIALAKIHRNHIVHFDIKP